jgi:hypothetical protein
MQLPHLALIETKRITDYSACTCHTESTIAAVPFIYTVHCDISMYNIIFYLAIQYLRMQNTQIFMKVQAHLYTQSNKAKAVMYIKKRHAEQEESHRHF